MGEDIQLQAARVHPTGYVDITKRYHKRVRIEPASILTCAAVSLTELAWHRYFLFISGQKR
jgi:hypothetical protein